MLLLIVVLAAAALYLRSRLGDLEHEIARLREMVDRLSRQAASGGAPRAPASASAVEVRAPTPSPIAASPLALAPPLSAPPPAPPPRPAAPQPAPPPLRQPPPRPPGGPPPIPTPPTPPPKRPSFDWERLVGVRLFSGVAGIALVVAAISFLKYSIEHGWLQPSVRVAIGIAVAIALLVACELKAARRYPVTANAMDAAAVAILFSTFFSAHALWHLYGTLPAFALLVMVTGLAVLLSIRRDSVFIALLGLVGGFATPALLSTGENRPFALFGYLLLLNAGLAWVAYRKKWRFLGALSLLFTVFYQWGWVLKFLTAPSVPVGIGVFLVFPILTFLALAIGRDDSRDQGRWGELFRQVPAVSAALPLLFALYLAALPGYGARFGLLFGFLLLVVVGLFAIAAARGPALLHALGALSAILVWALWLKSSYVPAAWPAVLAWLSAFVLFFLAAPVLVDRPRIAARWPAARARLSGPMRYVVYAAPLLLFVIPVLILLERRTDAPGLVFTVTLLLLAACAAFAIARAEGGVHYVAAFFALAAEAVWSARALTPERLLPALAVYGVFGLFYIGVPIVARRRGRPFTPQGAGGVLGLVSIALLIFLAGGAVAQTALWGVALLLAILNAGLFFEASSVKLPVLSLAGVLLSWIVLAIWWATASVATALLPALTVIGGFSLLALAGNLWARRRTDRVTATEFDKGIYLGLIGHLFLFFVATQSSLAVPPWPLLGVLLVLDLAIAAASLALRNGELHLAATVASALILMLWVQIAQIAPWPSVAVLAAAGVTALALLWVPLARRVGAQIGRFELAAAVAALLAQVVAIFAAGARGSPGLTFLIGAQVAFLVAALVIAARPPWGIIAVAAVAPSALAVYLWQEAHPEPTAWRDQLTFAVPIYLLFLIYPELRRRRGAVAQHAYLAAVLASAAFFIEARDAMRLGHLNGIIGALPLTQALLLALLLLGVRRGAAGVKTPLGIVALVAGAALAFVTVAIPLQLDKHWITVGWALEGAALAWLYTRVPHRGLLLGATGLLAAVFVRLALNPAVLTYEPRGELRIWNWYLYTYLLAAVAFLFAASMLRRTDDKLNPELPRVSSLLPAGATILLFLLLNLEIADYFAVGPTITFNFTAELAQDLTYTLGWAAFSVALLAAGIVRHNKPGRIAAIALLAVTVLKAFLHDLARLGGLYRVGSFVGLAISLALVALALQRFVLTPSRTPE